MTGGATPPPEHAPALEPIVDSPTAWVAKHVRRYVETDGRQGHRFSGSPALLLTTRGRKSGARRRTALIYGEDDGRYVLVASNGGAARHPAWYLNLVAQPEVELQVAAERFAGRARTAGAAERTRLWRLMTEIFPQYDAYQAKAAKAGREIPMVIVERAR